MHKRRRAIGAFLAVAAIFGISALLVLRPVVATTLLGSGSLVAGGFEVTPVSIKEVTAIGSESSGAGRSFYILRIRVADRSATADVRFDPHLVLVRSLFGGKPVRSRRGQDALGVAGRALLKPNEDVVENLAFEGPSGIRRISVRFNLLGGPGDLLSGLFGQSPQIELPVDGAGRP